MTDSQHCSVPLHPANHIPSTKDQHMASAIAADLQCNPAPHHPQNPQMQFDTFWTLCNRCRIRYEYQKMYLNRKLLCHHCQLPFMAIEMRTLSANVHSSRPCPAMFVAPKDSKSVLVSSTRPTEIATMVQSSGQRFKRGPKGVERAVSSSNNKPRGLKELSHADIRMLLNKARMEIIRELNK